MGTAIRNLAPKGTRPDGMWRTGTNMLLRLSTRARPLLAATATGVGATALSYSSTADCASWFSSKPKVHLKYFGLEGVAETIRHVMALGGLEWTEDAWAIDFSKLDMKDTTRTIPIASPGFAAAKGAGELDVNMGRAPVIFVDGKLEIGQSKTIERYLARRLGLLGKDEGEAAQIDAVTEHIRDIKDKYQKAKADKEEKAKFFSEVMPDFMQKMDVAVGKVSPKGGPALIGSSLSLADVTLFVFIKDFFDDKDLAAASIGKCPRLTASIKATGENPGVVAYREKRAAAKGKK